MSAVLDRKARALLAECARAGEDCVVVVVDHVEGSVPRERGAAMLVGARAMAGTIGGGHLELKSVAIAREMLSRKADATGGSIRRFPLGPALGQCCGGVAHVAFHVCRAGIAPPGLDLAAPAALFDLQLFGAGHVGQALVDVLAGVDCRITWIDSREQQFPERVPANARVEFSEAPQEEVAAAAANAFYLVMTHSHALDFAIVERILRRDDAGFIGLIGSQTKRVTFERRLRERGISRAAVDRMVCPIGLPDITGKSPGVVAIAVAAQMLAVATARSGAQAVLAVIPRVR